MTIIYKKMDPSEILPKEGNNQIRVVEIVKAQPVNLQNFPDPVGRVLITFEADSKRFCNSFLLTGTNTKLENLITATLGHLPNKVDLLDIKGRTFKGRIIHNQTKDGRTFAELSEVYLDEDIELDEEEDEQDEFEDSEEIDEEDSDEEDPEPVQKPYKANLQPDQDNTNRRKRNIKV